MVRILQLKQQLQTIKNGSLSITDYIMKIKAVGDALETAGHVVTDSDLVLSVLNGLGIEYDSVIIHVSSQDKPMNLQNVQYILMLDEQRIEQLNTINQVDVSSALVNFASFSDGGRGQRGGSQSRGQGKGRGKRKGGRWNNQKLHCQLCQKPGHSAFQCYKSLDQNWHGNALQNPLSHTPQHNQIQSHQSVGNAQVDIAHT
ncbi:hypothetical protein ACOSQ2_005931 [Xanthoceras sorbifolium]